MKKLVCIIIFLGLLLSLYAKSEQDSSLYELFKTLSNRSFYIKEKENSILEWKKMLNVPNISNDQTYEINSKLYHEYKTYQIDSAIVYVTKNIKLGGLLNSQYCIDESNIQLSSLYSIMGMYIESLSLLNNINKQHLDKRLYLNYYDAYKQLYEYYSYSNANESTYKNLSRTYRDSLLQCLDPKSNHYKIVYAEKISDAGKIQEAKTMIEEMLSKSREDDHEKAVLSFMLAYQYRKERNIDMQKKYFAISAISDTKKSIKENASLKALANALYENGEINSAYVCIKYSLEDAIFCNARLRTYEISEIFPIIDDAYQENVMRKNKELQEYLILISVLSVFLIIAVVYVYIQMRHLSRARKDLRTINNKLSELNTELQQTNKEMQQVNKELIEANHIKEEYISHFLDLCSSYIDKLEGYQKRLSKIATTKKVEDLYKALKSSDLIDKELGELYDNFDNIFLHLYPTFVDDFNSLLQPEERFTLKPGELLNIELRMYALIRLGITDNAKIAKFLRYSMSTIYNYRTKVRNKAIVPREQFDDLVLKIGFQSI